MKISQALFHIAQSPLGDLIVGIAFGRLSSLLPVSRIKENAYVIAFWHPRPSEGKAPSNLVSYGRYLLRPSIFDAADEVMKDHMEGEFMLVDAITKLASTKRVLVKKTEGIWLTTGDPLNHLKAQLTFALGHDKYKEEMEKFIKQLIKS